MKLRPWRLSKVFCDKISDSNKTTLKRGAMKRILGFILSFVFVFQLVTPVYAKGEPKVTLTAPTEAFWGETVTVNVFVEGQRKGAKELVLVIPADVATNVSAIEGNVLQKEDGSWQIRWKNKFTKKAMTATNEVVVTLIGGGGEQFKQLLIVKEGRKQLAESWLTLKDAEPKPTELIWSTSISAVDVLVGEPFFWTLSISNLTDQVLAYNFDLESWYTCAQTNPVNSSPTSAQLMKFVGDQFHTVWGWEGLVNPGEVVNWSLEMVTRPTPLPGCGVIKLKNNTTTVEEIAYIDVLPNPLPPHGSMVMSGVAVGQPATLEVALYSPNYTQFVMGEITSSDCQISGLPTGAVSSYPVTYKKFVYHPVVNAANNGQTGSVICHLTTTFIAKYSGFTDSYTVETEFLVDIP